MENTKKTIFKIDEFEKQFDYEICLSQIRFYNLKKGDFLAITLIFQKKENFQSNDPSTFIFTNPKRFGIENYEDLDDVKETKLYFERNDEVINEFVSISIISSLLNCDTIENCWLVDSFSFISAENTSFMISSNSISP